MSARTLAIVAKVLLVLGMLDFLAFLVVSSKQGGTAWNGKVVNGHYYVGEHGAYREVSEDVFRWSQLHAWSVVLTILPGMGIGLYLGLRGQERALD